ncbi:CLUMA_CG016636, isoform A [Clunio marinus]|uniref:Gustatory receptor n=1 Tax=Clunio marinus TaxID=568069 RepID=A0A1J1IVT8_9DIPT|nr:CLUMA_CG016636, isoform A [Clunio marinus]
MAFVPYTIRSYEKYYKISKLLGYRTTTIRNGKTVLTLSDVLILILALSIGIGICFLGFSYSSALVTSESDIAMEAEGVVVCRAFLLLEWLFNMTVVEGGGHFYQLGYPVNYTKQMNRINTFWILQTCLLVPFSVIVFYLEQSFIKILFRLYGSVYFCITIAGLTNSIAGVNMRLKTSNEIVRINLNQNETKSKIIVEEKTKTDSIELISTLTEIYDILIDCCGDINTCYGFVIMTSFGLCFFGILFTIFTACTHFLHHGNLSISIIISISFSIYYLFVLMSVIYTSARNKIEAQHLLKSLNVIMNHSKDPLKTASALSFSLLIKRRPPTVTCGLFDVDWKILFSMISSATTYLVILMQFESSAASKRHE